MPSHSRSGRSGPIQDAGIAVVRITHNQSIGKNAAFSIPYDYLNEI
jgi:hypothetical protein